MSAVERVNKAWDRIEVWYAKNAPKWTLSAGTSDEEIDAVAKHLEVTFPEELRVSLKRHNGIEDGHWPKGWLLPVNSIKDEWWSWTETERGGDFVDDDVETDGTFQKKFWCDKWVPIDGDGGGNCHILDLAPGPKGRIGQVLFFDHEVGPSKSDFPDFAGYLEAIADGLEKGRYYVEGDTYIADKEGDEDGEGDEDEEGDEGDEDEEDEEDAEDEEEEKPKNKKKVKK